MESALPREASGAAAALRWQPEPTRRISELPGGIQSSKSDAVEAGMGAFAASWRTSAAPWDEWMEIYEALRADFARFIMFSRGESGNATATPRFVHQSEFFPKS